MTREEMARLLAKIQLGDNRQVTALVLQDWMETLGHLNYEDAYRAVVEHRRESTDYLMPAHITQRVRRYQRERDMRARPLAIERRPVTLDRDEYEKQVAWFINHPGATVDDYEARKENDHA
ncbi:hypothetical protein ACWXWW_16530 [Microbacterium sp. KNMS]